MEQKRPIFKIKNKESDGIIIKEAMPIESIKTVSFNESLDYNITSETDSKFIKSNNNDDVPKKVPRKYKKREPKKESMPIENVTINKDNIISKPIDLASDNQPIDLNTMTGINNQPVTLAEIKALLDSYSANIIASISNLLKTKNYFSVDESNSLHNESKSLHNEMTSPLIELTLLHNEITLLRNESTSLHNEMTSSPNESKSSPKYNFSSSEPSSSPIIIRPETIKEENTRINISTQPKQPIKEKTLKDLIREFDANEIVRSNEIVQSNERIQTNINTFFSMIYILNETDNGINIANKLASMGIHTSMITIIYSDFPERNRYSRQYKYLYFIKDALDNAVELENNKPVLILSDSIMIRNELFFEFNLADHNKLGSFDVVQFGFKKVHKLKRSGINTEYYTKSYPLSNFKTDLEANRHWQKVGFNEGRVAMQNITEYDSSTISIAPQDNFAFSVSSSFIPSLSTKIGILIKTTTPTGTPAPIFIAPITLGNFYPNLFIQRPDVVKNNILAKYMWHMPSYSS